MEHQTLTLMNPFPGDRPEAAEIRQRQGYSIAAQTRIKRHLSGYKVPSQSGRGTHYVVLDEQPSCTCADFEHRGRACKHIYAVEFARQGKNLPDGDSVENFTNRITYGRDWRAYNASQTRELEHFFVLLRDLCDTVEATASDQRAAPLAAFGRAVRGHIEGLLHQVWPTSHVVLR